MSTILSRALSIVQYDSLCLSALIEYRVANRRSTCNRTCKGTHHQYRSAATVEEVNSRLLGWWLTNQQFTPDRCRFPTANHFRTPVFEAGLIIIRLYKISTFYLVSAREVAATSRLIEYHQRWRWKPACLVEIRSIYMYRRMYIFLSYRRRKILTAVKALWLIINRINLHNFRHTSWNIVYRIIYQVYFIVQKKFLLQL